MKDMLVLVSRVSVYLFMHSGVCSINTHIVLSTKEHKRIEINTNRNVSMHDALAYMNKHGMKMTKIEFSDDGFVAEKDRYTIEKKHRK